MKACRECKQQSGNIWNGCEISKCQVAGQLQAPDYFLYDCAPYISTPGAGNSSVITRLSGTLVVSFRAPCIQAEKKVYASAGEVVGT